MHSGTISVIKTKNLLGHTHYTRNGLTGISIRIHIYLRTSTRVLAHAYSCAHEYPRQRTRLPELVCI